MLVHSSVARDRIYFGTDLKKEFSDLFWKLHFHTSIMININVVNKKMFLS